MQKNTKTPAHLYHYFLDEAGDPSFFGKGRSVIVGTPGVSSCYYLGMVQFHYDLNTIRKEIADLQNAVMNDDYFRKIGSINKKKNKYGFYFHATDDIPEVRMLFYKYIRSLPCSCEIIVAKKMAAIFTNTHNENPHEFYTDLLSHLLYDKVPYEDKLVLNIAERGNTTNITNLRSALQQAEERFNDYNPEITISNDISFNVQNQISEPLLNVADYFCWSIQRLFEKGETRYYDYLQDKIKMVIDLYDEDGIKKDNRIYTPENPLRI